MGMIGENRIAAYFPDWRVWEEMEPGDYVPHRDLFLPPFLYSACPQPAPIRTIYCANFTAARSVPVYRRGYVDGFSWSM